MDSNHCDCAKVLLDASSDTNIAESNGLTPLHVAAHRGTKDIATLLLERDARIGAVDKVIVILLIFHLLIPSLFTEWFYSNTLCYTSGPQ